MNEQDNGQAGGPSYIEDGYTATAYCEDQYVDPLEEDRGPRYEPCRFTYRPLLVTTQAQITQRMERQARDPVARLNVIAVWIGKQVVTWDMVKRSNGQPVDHTIPEEVLHVHSDQFMRIWRMILGEIPSDPDPDHLPYDSGDTITEETLAPEPRQRELAAEKN